MATQARCKKCRIHYTWNPPKHPKRGYLFKWGLACPECQGPLAPTTCECKDRKSEKAPLGYKQYGLKYKGHCNYQGGRK